MSNNKENQSTSKWQKIAEEEEKQMEQEVTEALADEASIEIAASTADTVSRDKIPLLEQEITALKDQCLRLRAEQQNALSRMEQEVAKARKFSVSKIIEELIPVAESLGRSLEGLAANPAGDALHKGSALTLEMLLKVLEKHGVETINPVVGASFDPHSHEAMSMVPNPEAKSNTIIQVLQKGYALHGRVIKAAMVIVAA